MRSRSPVRQDTGVREASAGRPVMLATLGVPFDPEASSFAVDSAVEAGQPLLVVNVTALEPLAMSVMLGYDALEEFTPETSASVREPAELARSLGIEVERLRVRSPRPVEALLQLTAEREPGLLVFGPDRRRVPRRRYTKAVRAIQADARCLVWVPA
jgi:hypothetical protein